MNLAKLQHGMMKNTLFSPSMSSTLYNNHSQDLINRLEINFLKIMNFVDTNMRAMIMTHQWNIKIRM